MLYILDVPPKSQMLVHILAELLKSICLLNPLVLLACLSGPSLVSLELSQGILKEFRKGWGAQEDQGEVKVKELRVILP